MPEKPEHLDEIISLLESEHGIGPWNWHTRQGSFEVLISTVLSQRTKDANTDKAAKALLSRFPDPWSLSDAGTSEIESLIRPANYHKTKARKVKEISRIITERFKGNVPQTMEELTGLPGVGKKTASCTLLYGHGISRIPVDVHVMVISRRLGWTDKEDPDEVQEDLERKLPEKEWHRINELMVKHGQAICHTMNPKCWLCPIGRFCRYERKRLIQPK